MTYSALPYVLNGTRSAIFIVEAIVQILRWRFTTTSQNEELALTWFDDTVNSIPSFLWATAAETWFASVYVSESQSVQLWYSADLR